MSISQVLAPNNTKKLRQMVQNKRKTCLAHFLGGTSRDVPGRLGTSRDVPQALLPADLSTANDEKLGIDISEVCMQSTNYNVMMWDRCLGNCAMTWDLEFQSIR